MTNTASLGSTNTPRSINQAGPGLDRHRWVRLDLDAAQGAENNGESL
jgi:hypothetical protein